MHKNGKVAVITAFSTIALSTVFDLIVGLDQRVLTGVSNVFIFGAIIYVSYVLKNDTLEVVWRSSLLASGFAIGVKLCSSSIFGSYLSILCFFHFTEYITTSMIRPQQLTIDSFLLNHSQAYAIAAAASWLEFLIELYLLPGLKNLRIISNTGVAICLVGEIIRKGAMLTAWSNFDHLVRFEKEDDHQLVSHGIYNWCRHPSYVGWFYWSIGTQIILCNPICTILYAMASWKFFNQRVYEEEITLCNFFGQQYTAYQKRVSTGLPFIEGYVPVNFQQ
uniref:Protein-S-isoprenylcysteine O-methyltransferase n=1 Tax=Lynceus sp. MCZ IZ 141354 TaxID=1930659 RepID=A0A9N6WYU3_9CRUS|nr:EOG090X0CFU [Lynceus sp. MCZ IZ 141354]